MVKLTEEQLHGHLKNVVDPSILAQIPEDALRKGLEGMSQAMEQHQVQAQTGRGGNSR